MMGWTVSEWVTRVSLLLAFIMMLGMSPVWAEIAREKRKKLLEEGDDE